MTAKIYDHMKTCPACKSAAFASFELATTGAGSDAEAISALNSDGSIEELNSDEAQVRVFSRQEGETLPIRATYHCGAAYLWDYSGETPTARERLAECPDAPKGPAQTFRVGSGAR